MDNITSQFNIQVDNIINKFYDYINECLKWDIYNFFNSSINYSIVALLPYLEEGKNCVDNYINSSTFTLEFDLTAEYYFVQKNRVVKLSPDKNTALTRNAITEDLYGSVRNTYLEMLFDIEKLIEKMTRFNWVEYPYDVNTLMVDILISKNLLIFNTSCLVK